jgi:hypothetical protein
VQAGLASKGERFSRFGNGVSLTARDEREKTPSSLHVEVSADSISPNLAAILQQLLAPLYAVFDFFQMPLNVVEEELARFRSPR